MGKENVMYYLVTALLFSAVKFERLVVFLRQVDLEASARGY